MNQIKIRHKRLNKISEQFKNNENLYDIDLSTIVKLDRLVATLENADSDALYMIHQLKG